MHQRKGQDKGQGWELRFCHHLPFFLTFHTRNGLRKKYQSLCSTHYKIWRTQRGFREEAQTSQRISKSYLKGKAVEVGLQNKLYSTFIMCQALY